MSETARQGDWVRVYWVVLSPGERAPQLPDETKRVPLEARAKGELLDAKARLGETVRIRTQLGRILEGRLEVVNPPFGHDFGRAVPELLAVGRELRTMLKESKA